MIDGVTLRRGEDGFPPPKPDETYLLFLRFDESRRLAHLSVGDAGTFHVLGDRIESPVGTSLASSPIGFDLEMRHALSLSRVEEAVSTVP